MSFWQIAQDERYLRRNNGFLKGLVSEIPGASLVTSREDTGIEILDMVVGQYRFKINYTNTFNANDFWFHIRSADGKNRLGSKLCNSRPHAKNAIRHIVKMSVEDATAYLNQQT